MKIKKLLILIKLELISCINSKKLFYIASIFFFNGIVLSMIFDHPTVFLINFVIIGILLNYILESKHYKYLSISLNDFDFLLMRFLSFIGIKIILLIFLPVFSIIMNLNTHDTIMLIVTSSILSIVLSSINTMISIVKIFNIAQYHFIVILLFPILMPCTLLCHALLDNFQYNVLLILLSGSSILTFVFLHISYFLLQRKNILNR